MKIAITGSTGLIGSAVADFFQQQNNTVTLFCRPAKNRQADERTCFWDAVSGNISASDLKGHDCFIHLAGENIAARRWSPQYKEAIFDSRVKGTQVLCQSLAQLSDPPKVLLSASAVGYYGNHLSSDSLDELSLKGDDYLADVCHHWEQATLPASEAGIRVVLLRLGVVFSRKGGALAKMLIPFKLGLGGRVGPGTQTMSWIALDELLLIMKYLIDTESIHGAVNCVSPEPVSNSEFTKVLGKVLHRPTVFPLPTAVVKLLFGEMGETLLLGGQRVYPKKLIDSGYHFKYQSLEDALNASIHN